MRLAGRGLGVFVLALLCALPSLSASAVCPPREDDVLTPWRQITWDDFRGGEPARLGPALAQITTAVNLEGIGMEAEEVEPGRWVATVREICLFAAMNKLHSSRKPEARKPDALKHEQVHFDIAEVTARQLHPKLMVLEAEGSSQQKAKAALHKKLRETTIRAHRELDQLQRTYDEKTYHGTVWMMQRKWNRKVERWLEETPSPYPSKGD
ncbi:MAG: DUF922 domain-containing protein [Acidobacteriota bacterium]|nr:DUF922 domain-containing protein [Acidobacteriota bacterium]